MSSKRLTKKNSKSSANPQAPPKRLGIKTLMMYKITDTIDRYPHVVLQLKDITTGYVRYWCFSVLHAEELCKDYHVRTLKGVLLDRIPHNGGWIKKEDINYI